MRTIKASLLISALVALAPMSALGEEARDRAREHARQARIHYDLGRFEEALAEYEAAYEALPAPGALFNIGQCHRQMGNHERAIFFFEGYLRQAPGAENRADAEELLALSRTELERAPPPDEVEAPPPDEVEAPPPDEIEDPPPDEGMGETSDPGPDRPFYRRGWFWAVVGVVVIGAGLGVGLGVGLNPGDPTVVLPGGTVGTLDARDR